MDETSTTPSQLQFDKIVKVAATSFAATAILRAENAALRAYEHRRENKAGARTQITKARVIDDAELQERQAMAEERAAKALAAKKRKEAQQQLAKRRISVITLEEEITDDED